MLGNRLAAHLPLPAYTAERHAAWLAGWALPCAAQRIAGVLPGARLLLHAGGEPAVRAVPPQIDAVEALGISPAAVSPASTMSENLSADSKERMAVAR